MRTSRFLMLVPAAAVMAACGGAKPTDGLANDLALATQATPYMPQQTVSPGEMGYGQSPYGAPSPYGYPQQIQTVQREPVYSSPRTTTRRSSSSGTYSRGTVYSAPAEPVRHTQRDAAVGAGIGAVIGATTSRDKVKGGLIGAAAGGILGAIVGHNVDVQQP